MISDKVNKVYYSFTLILLWSTYGIFLPCCLFFLSIFFSSPNLSRRILDVCHTATDGVTLVRILRCKSETCCTRLAKKYRTQKPAKIRHLGTIAQLCRAISSQLRHASTVEKNLPNSNTSSTRLHNMVNVGSLTAAIGLPVWGTPANFNGFRVLAGLLHGTLTGRQRTFAALNRGRHLY